jgi:hypothetical protein
MPGTYESALKRINEGSSGNKLRSSRYDAKIKRQVLQRINNNRSNDPDLNQLNLKSDIR